MKKLIPLLGFAALALTLTVATPTPASAFLDFLDPHDGGNEAPEIDPSAVGSALALALGGAAMLRDRFRR